MMERHGNNVLLHLAEQDTGIGMAAKILEQIFMLFAQAEVPIARKHGSAGLGLAICRRLVELIGGRFHVKSREGAGRMSHRLQTFQVVDLAQFVQPQSDLPPTAWDGLALRIFLVEDNAIYNRCAMALLGRLGHQPGQICSFAKSLIYRHSRADGNLVQSGFRPARE